MNSTAGDWTPVVEVDMLVRRPAVEVWEAFEDPDRISRFWLARSTGRLETGATVRWSFKMAEPRPRSPSSKRSQVPCSTSCWDGGQPLRISFEDRRRPPWSAFG